MLIAAAGLALSLFSGGTAQMRATPVDSGATSSCITPSRTGTFRLIAVNRKNNEPNQAVLLLENIEGCLEVTFVTEGSAPAIIDHISVSGDSLRGSMRLGTGTAAVSFTFSEKDVAGSIVEGHHEWTVEGRRTS